mgnify:CR=1 FL=1
MSDNKSADTKSKVTKRIPKKKKVGGKKKKKQEITGKDVADLCDQFESFIVDDEKKLSSRQIKDFSRENLFKKEDDELVLDYKSYTIFTFKICGIEIDLEDPDEVAKFEAINEENCSDQDTIENLIGKCKGRNKKIKVAKIAKISSGVTEFIYNNFDILKEKQFKGLKTFISKCLDLSECGYRVIRVFNSNVICKVFQLLFKEVSATESLIQARSSENSEDSKNKKSASTEILLQNKLTIFRVILIPFFVVFLLIPYLYENCAGNYVALAIFCVASLTDLLDGKIVNHSLIRFSETGFC